jgi:alpha-amylase/alpha-mannosidase (GH57 family)
VPVRSIVIHGHFYQPPRENPWLEAVEVQDGATPFHDWNARVTAECYAPNTAARRVDERNRILDIVNNFQSISFDVGPTLAAWLAREAPEVWSRIVEADRASVRAREGHGNAIAQVYNHMILPLASRRDKVTQVLWGLADFRARFGREAEGMWLPETAVDEETLEVLAEAGLGFTILAPSQARRVRPLEGGEWEEVGEGIDPTRPYLWRGPRGLALALFFYDAAIARGIAFEGLLDRGEGLVARLAAAFSDARPWAQLVHAATDGESYGHHRRFGEMALAAAIRLLQADPAVTLTNYGAFLAEHPPTHEVQIRERTSWSCAHGIERWRADCGCRLRGDWHQRWRGPLREALDWLAGQIDPFFESRLGAHLEDPWAARDDYVRVVLDRRPETLDAFFARHQRVALDQTARLESRRLLELERNRMLMYTSCGWFFDEIAAIEPTQILRYAALAIQYVRDLGGGALEDPFLARLAAAPSNVPAYRDGAEVYRRLVRPAAADVRRVVAHYGIIDLLENWPDDATVHAYRVERLDGARHTDAGTTLRLGRVRVSSTITGEVRETMYAALHFGGHDLLCGVRPWEDAATWDALREALVARHAHHSLVDTVRALDEHFPGEPYSLPHLFLDERRRVLERLIRSVQDRYEETYRRIWEGTRKLVRYLREVDVPVPDAFALAARHVLEQDLLGELHRLDATGGRELPARVFELAAEAAALGLTLDLRPARPVMHRVVGRALDAVAADPSADRVAEAHALIAGTRRLDVDFALWPTQNRYYAIWGARPDARARLEPLGEALGFRLEAAVTPERPA